MKTGFFNRNKVMILIILFLTISSIVLVESISTMSVYVKRESDVIQAYYTPLAMSDNAEGKIVALDSETQGGVTTYSGELSLIIYNYAGENVTGRDIAFSISEPTEYYDASGRVIDNPSSQNLSHYVKDVFSVPMIIGAETHLYDVCVIGEELQPVSHILTAVENDIGEPAPNSINLTIKISKTLPEGTPFTTVDNLSIILHLTQPYTDKYVINIKASDRLIVYSAVSMEKMEFETTRVYMQTKHELLYDNNPLDVNDAVAFMGFKLIFTWKNLSLDLVPLKKYNHMRYTYEVNKDAQSLTHTLTLYVPAGSDFYLDFYDENYDSLPQYVYVSMQLYDNTLQFENSQVNNSGGNLVIYNGYDNEDSFIYSPANNVHSISNLYKILLVTE